MHCECSKRVIVYFISYFPCVLSCIITLQSYCSDPESEIPFAQALYGNDRFMRAFFDALSDDGILVMQLGQAPKFSDPDETFSKFKNRATTTKLLEKLGFESVHAYEEVSNGDMLLSVKCDICELYLSA